MKPGPKPQLALNQKPVQDVFLKLVRLGYSDSKAAFVTGVTRQNWTHLRNRDAAFSAAYDDAARERNGCIAIALVETMVEQIKRKGHPWWAKLAIWNFRTGLRDPDAETSRSNLLDSIAAKMPPAKDQSSEVAEPTRAIAG